MDIYLFCIVQKEFIFIKIAEGIVIEFRASGVMSVCAALYSKIPAHRFMF